jgi:phosphatidylserine decarboxylase
MHSRPAQELIAMLEAKPELQAMLEHSLALARENNPDKTTNPVQCLEEYLDFIDRYVSALPWRLFRSPGGSIYENCLRGSCYELFLTDQELDELKGRGLWRPSLNYYPPFRDWQTGLMRALGEAYDAPSSWGPETLKEIEDSGVFNLDRGWYEAPKNWHSFNEFFARRLSSPQVRPVASPDDDCCVVSPADSRPQGVWRIGGDNLLLPRSVDVKSTVWHSVAELLGDSPFRDSFAGGSFTHAYLDFVDYHRYHFPVGGVVRDVRIYPRERATGLATWDGERMKYLRESGREGYRWRRGSFYDHCDDFSSQDWSVIPEWQALEARGCVVVETHSCGLAAVLPVGMSRISSVNFEPNVKPGAMVKKGDPLGWFLFGGSDIVMLFQRGWTFTIDAVPAADGMPHEHILACERYGTLKKN